MKYEVIVNQVKDLMKDVGIHLRKDVYEFLKNYEKNIKGDEKNNISKLIENANLARQNKTPYCQDTGLAIIFCEIGQNISIENGFIGDAIQEGIKLASEEAYLRKSVVLDPLLRNNSKTNTPAIIHYEIIPGDDLKISILAKGFGSENKGQIKMFNPTASKENIIDFVVKVAKEAGANACPPFILGVGIGGTMDKASLLAKKALLKSIGEKNPKTHFQEMEKNILEKVNQLGIGPFGLGGNLTAMDVKILDAPTHIAGLPVAVNIGCHAMRSGRIELD